MAAEIFRIDGDKIVERWGLGQQPPVTRSFGTRVSAP